MGVKKIDKVKIDDIAAGKVDLDYDTVMEFYQKVVKRKKEAFELEKNKKVKDIEHWARALKEEECKAMIKYCETHGEEEMKQIKKAIQERREKELKMKTALKPTKALFENYKKQVMEVRHQEHKEAQTAFIN